ncbi:MAG TPA: bifunctional phosphopantothenoylcysteine decarboxylase/phosphopantothenate--cysteine ligase CoaBC [Ruminococcaceae bacterium]|mgnify:CR=1 FL=1|nr:bifunctional phosphopantothenoylcysteine decarboxylase/phosphopantothenate--cysteine ligase CoaBC [Oscillospiraceae bacterium]
MKNKNIILGVTGSIAAYRAADVANSLTKDGYNVNVIMTKGATAFVTPLTFQTLSKNRVCTDVFEQGNPAEVAHIAMAKRAGLLLIAPASADVIGKIAGGIADDMLTSTVLAVHGIPRLIAPSMNTYMYLNPAVQENLRRLKKYGYEIIEPKEARLACGDVGKGALADVKDIVAAAESHISQADY